MQGQKARMIGGRRVKRGRRLFQKRSDSDEGSILVPLELEIPKLYDENLNRVHYTPKDYPYVRRNIDMKGKIYTNSTGNTTSSYRHSVQRPHNRGGNGWA